MKRHIILCAVVACTGLIGCSPSSDGDPEAAAKAAAAAPKSVDQLPADMPPEAKASAASAMGRSQAMQQQANDPARARAMQEMQKQR